MDPGTVCMLFDICLSLIEERRPSCGMVVALDEAHKYMTASLAAANFTQRLLGAIREQRHNGTRVIIATQEPTISETLLDLCTTSIIHRFTSPAWFRSMRNHLGAASNLASTPSERQAMFIRIMELETGHSLVFSPPAFLCLSESGTINNLGGTILSMKTRTRMGQDGGMSVLAAPRRCSSARQPSEAVDSEEKYIKPAKDSSWNERTVVADESILSDDETCETRQQGVSVEQLHECPVGEGDAGSLDQTKSQLALICCLCERLAAIESPSSFLPGLNGVIEEGLRSGIAYATCVQCQLKYVPESKKATKAFDLAKGKEFITGTVKTSQTTCRAVQASLQLRLGRDLALLVHDGHLVYLFARVVQRSMTDGALLWTLQISSSEGSDSQSRLSPHQDGNFFKSSLQPNIHND